MSDARSEVRAMLAEQMAILERNIIDDARLRPDLGLDSLDIVEIVMELEERHGWEISDHDTDRIAGMTVAELIAYVDRRIASAA